MRLTLADFAPNLQILIPKLYPPSQAVSFFVAPLTFNGERWVSARTQQS